MFRLLAEEEIPEHCLEEYADGLYRVVCVGEREKSLQQSSGLVRTTYLVDWEQLIHLLESYEALGEDIIEVAALDNDAESEVMRAGARAPTMGRA